MPVNPFKNLFKKSKSTNSPRSDISYSGNLFELRLTGNAKTKDGCQIEDWKSAASIKIAQSIGEWDRKTPLDVEMPNNGKGEIKIFIDLLKGENLPEKLPDLGYFTLCKSSKTTDFVNGSFLDQYGWIVSSHAKAILEQFNLGEHCFYPVVLEHRDVRFDYFFLKTCANGDEYIDYEKSTFYSYTERTFDEEHVKRDLNSKQEFDLFTKQQNGIDFPDNATLYARPIQLQKKFPEYDLFYVREFFFSSAFVSERLKDALEPLTGIELTPSKRVELYKNN